MSSQFDYQNDPDNYKWGIFYYNPRDKRIFLPKRIPFMGFTLNFANPYSYLILLMLLGIIIFFSRIGAPHSQFPKIW